MTKLTARRARAALWRFGRFWYDFVVGDDWRLAVGALVAIGLTWLVGRHVPSWWVMVVVVPAVLALSLRRAATTTHRPG
jgi:hypothetical protein